MDPALLTWIGIIVIAIAVVLTLFGYAIYCGLLHDIEVATGKPAVKNFTFAYKFARGPYKECGSLFTEACSIGPNLRCIAIYYDDPLKVCISYCNLQHIVVMKCLD